MRFACSRLRTHRNGNNTRHRGRGTVPVAIIPSFFIESYVSSMTGAVKSSDAACPNRLRLGRRLG
jgi:hypothetical protein